MRVKSSGSGLGSGLGSGSGSGSGSHRVDAGRVELDSLGGQLLEQRDHLALLAHLLGLEGSGLKAVEVRLARARHDHRAKALGEVGR